MTISNAGRTRTGIAALMLGSLAIVSGCQGDRMSSVSTRPEPLRPAPSGTVVGSQLPPPSGPTDPSAFPPAPTVPGQTLPGQTGTDVTSLDPAAGTAPVEPVVPAGAADLTVGSVAGVWSVNVAGQSCRVATPQTKFGQGYRAGPLGCPAPMDGVKSWNVAGKQLSLYDESGNALARLYSSGAERFDGQTTSGQPISLSR